MTSNSRPDQKILIELSINVTSEKNCVQMVSSNKAVPFPNKDDECVPAVSIRSDSPMITVSKAAIRINNTKNATVREAVCDNRHGKVLVC